MTTSRRRRCHRLGAIGASIAIVVTACGPRDGSISPVGDPDGVPVTAATIGDPTRCAGDPARPDTRRYDSIVGVDPNLLSLDVYTGADAESCPVVIWVHGGGWRIGDKAGRGVEEKVTFLGELGVSVVSVNYRLALPDNDVRWPDFGNDVAHAVAWVIEHGADLGLDPTRLALIGHSAGAHLVSIVATNPSLLGENGQRRDAIDCVISLDTAADDLRDPSLGLERLVDNAFGDDAAARADGSPLVQVGEHPEGVAPFLLVTRGRRSRTDGAEEFAAALRAAGTDAEVLNANPYSHMQVNTELGSEDEDAVTAPVSRFLTECLR